MPELARCLEALTDKYNSVAMEAAYWRSAGFPTISSRLNDVEQALRNLLLELFEENIHFRFVTTSDHIGAIAFEYAKAETI